MGGKPAWEEGGAPTSPPWGTFWGTFGNVSCARACAFGARQAFLPPSCGTSGNVECARVCQGVCQGAGLELPPMGRGAFPPLSRQTHIELPPPFYEHTRWVFMFTSASGETARMSFHSRAM